MVDLNLSDFNIYDDLLYCNPITVGHINKTFRLKFFNGDYVAQIVNSKVFPSIETLMDNISIVCNHLKYKGVPTLEYVNTYDGFNYSINRNGDYVRISKYVDNSITFENSNDLEYIYNAGKGFGEFCSNLSDIPYNTLKDTIKDFHNTKLYLDRLFNSANIPKYQARVEQSESLLNDILLLKDYSNVTQSAIKRVTHNDTKFSNILFNRYDKSHLCVIDLDTTMNGYISYDFADGVRSICRNDDYTLNLSKFEAYSKGFLSYPISIGDKSILIDSIIAVSLELSSRYLYEYITDGNYFNLKTPIDNLDKARKYIYFIKDVISKRNILSI